MHHLLAATITPEQAQGMLDHAARQSDRWLFIAILVVLLVCLLVAVVYLAKWIKQTMQEMRNDRIDLMQVIRENSMVLNQVRERLR